MESIIVDGVEYVPAASIVELQSLLAKHHAALVEQQKPGPWPTKEVIDKAVAAEREACARLAEDCVDIEKLADDIRARGET